MKFNEICSIGVSALSEKTKTELQNYSTRPAKIIESFPCSEDELIDQIDGSDCLLVSLLTQINKRVIESCQNLRYIGLAGTHPSHIDVVAAGKKGVSVVPVDGYCDYETAEFIIAQLLNLYRGNKGQNRTDKPRSLHKKKIGIIGLGRVGKKLANMCLAMGMEVCYYSRSQKSDMESNGLKYLPIDELVGYCDILSLHTPAYQEMITAEMFPLIKSGTTFVNTCLGQTMNQPALWEWLSIKENHLILDSVASLFYQKLDTFDNAIVASHSAYDTQESYESMNEIIIQNIRKFLQQ